MSSQSTPAPEAPTPRKGEFARLAGVLTDPKVAFADIVVHPRWWVPLALVVVLAIVYMAAYSRHVGWGGYIRHTIETNSRTQNLPVEQRERIIEQQTRYAPVLGYVIAVAARPGVALITAGLLLFVFKLMLDAQLTFRQVFAVTCYSFLTGVL
ncbi:MAG: YIP1 family protein [Acidobacteria bacterium]|nr:YIP1 family protein [Acidobacteriota bacterium]